MFITTDTELWICSPVGAHYSVVGVDRLLQVTPGHYTTVRVQPSTTATTVRPSASILTLPGKSTRATVSEPAVQRTRRQTYLDRRGDRTVRMTPSYSKRSLRNRMRRSAILKPMDSYAAIAARLSDPVRTTA